MHYDFDLMIDRRGSDAIKWDGAEMLIKYGYCERFDDATIPLFVADMDFAIPDPVRDALRRRAEQPMFGYTTHTANSDYYAAILGWFGRRMQWQINKDHIVFSPGTVAAVNTCIQAYSQKGEGIIIQPPVYAPFFSSIKNNERLVVENRLINDNGYYRIDFADLDAKAAQPENTMLILCSPHNPVGRIWQPDELRQMAEICQRHDVIIVTDEIHGDLIRCDQTFYPLASLIDDPRIVTCTAINKTFNLAGLHCSNIVIADDKMREAYLKAQGFQTPTPFAISALIAAYNEGEEWLEQLKAYLDNTFNWLDKFIGKNLPDVAFRIPEGTYIAWLDFNAMQLSPEEIHDRIYNKANVLFQDGNHFGEGYDHFQRICLPSPLAMIKEAMARVAAQF
jgi:cystathionine beta-lyase